MADFNMANVLWAVVLGANGLGPGYAQEGYVLRTTAEELQIRGNLAEEQRLLSEWQLLFLTRKLAWGYNIDNPSHPFFHIVAQ